MEWVVVGAYASVPIKSWCRDIEDGAYAQALNLSSHPTVYHHVALMPDCHQGYGMPIGGVIAVTDAVIPNAVGVDIGCGMLAVKTNLESLSIPEVKKIMGAIRELVPVGFSRHKKQQDSKLMPDIPLQVDRVPISFNEYNSALFQLGTLGGGNHFIELQMGDDGYVWFMIHSGSRNIGFKVAKRYNEVAIKLNESFHSSTPKEHGLAFLPRGTEEYEKYMAEMNFCLDFAKANRDLMADRVMDVLEDQTNARFTVTYNIHHNYARLENHFDKNVIVHRKGATSAYKGQIGIIPGSMGTSSFIVKGKGNLESFQSCSHGAGRAMSRTQASKTLSEEECNAAMEGIVFGRWGRDRKDNVDLGEAPQAYKDINEVIKAQLDLIEPVVTLKPLGVIKG